MVLRLSIPYGWPATFDPQRSGATEIAVERLNYERLTRLDAALQTVPAAAERWEYTPDAMAITFHPRAGLTYSNGEALTSRAFAYAARARPAWPGPYQTALATIAGADALLATALPTDSPLLDARFAQLGKALVLSGVVDELMP